MFLGSNRKAWRGLATEKGPARTAALTGDLTAREQKPTKRGPMHHLGTATQFALGTLEEGTLRDLG